MDNENHPQPLWNIAKKNVPFQTTDLSHCLMVCCQIQQFQVWYRFWSHRTPKNSNRNSQKTQFHLQTVPQGQWLQCVWLGHPNFGLVLQVLIQHFGLQQTETTLFSGR